MRGALAGRRSLVVLIVVALVVLFFGGCGGLFNDYGYMEEPYDGYNYGESERGEYESEEVVDRHDDFGENVFIDAASENTSTFSADVNTASYTMARRALREGRLPARESVRVEEFINFFRFDYPDPQEGAFSVNMEAGPSYFGSEAERDRHLLRIGIRGREVSVEEMKPTNLVFLVDVSGSMGTPTRMPLAKKALRTMVKHLRATDRVAIQTYADGSDRVLSPTLAGERSKVLAAIDKLEAKGSTFGEGGIVDAYNMAEEAFIEGGNNRVIILTDGDFNVGKRDEDIVEIIQSYREREIALTAVGFGHGGYNDRMMEHIARVGNGNYFYVDTEEEAERIFGEGLPSTIEVIAADVKIQVEFNADVVDRYRLIGYEKRMLDNEDFDDDLVDAGEVGPGHRVTALYELELHEEMDRSALLGEVRVRHKAQFGEESREQSSLLKVGQIQDDFEGTTTGFRFAAAVAEFAQILRGGQFVQGARFDEVREIAEGGADEGYGDQQEFLELVDLAKGLWDE